MFCTLCACVVLVYVDRCFGLWFVIDDDGVLSECFSGVCFLADEILRAFESLPVFFDLLYAFSVDALALWACACRFGAAFLYGGSLDA